MNYYPVLTALYYNILLQDLLLGSPGYALAFPWTHAKNLPVTPINEGHDSNYIGEWSSLLLHNSCIAYSICCV